MSNLEKFLASVQAMPSTKDVFNPWRDFDSTNDIDKHAPEHRFDHLTRYMTERLKSAKVILQAEAIGYAGGKFSGCAMTSERSLMAANDKLAFDQIYFNGPKYRTSKVQLSSGKSNMRGSIEPTASIVWSTMLQRFGSHEFLTWNTFAWHPHLVGDMLSNRTPTEEEIERGADTLRLFLAAFPDRKVVAVGRKAEFLLTNLGIEHHPVRHPANGGATKFREGIAALKFPSVQKAI